MAPIPPEPTPAERRAWRLALLLTGDAAGADAVAVRVLEAQPDLDAIEPMRRDRLVVLRAREHATGQLAQPAVGFADRLRAGHLRRRGVDAEAETAPAQAFSGLANALMQFSLRRPRQQHEALMLHRVEGMELRDTARAMDCSTTAAARHLDEAERVIADTMGADYPTAGAALREQSAEATPGDEVVRVRVLMAKMRRIRTVLLAAITLLLIGACAVTVWLLLTRGQTP
ncbi:MAG: hypothetical protein ACF8QF_05555 [Phycisphaerales bacterium]